ncbi:MAG: CBASS cGAMP-activated phospholipase [Rhodoblastus sp.]|uniref:CBASS cGAMP-activated phospholipase n=1 Tax=Rhodoblastus sp. TaxID=1962975 RepID=UPI003F992F70
MSERFNILSLSGGGFLGLYSIAVLAALEKEFGAPIARHFDLIAGTSIGGIIGLGLAREVPASDMQEAFARNGTTIFSGRPAPTGLLSTIADLRHSFLKPKYQPAALRTTIVDLVGEDTRIGELKHRIIIPTVNLTKGRPQVFKTPHHETFRTDLHQLVVEVALATSAAPTYFPVAEVGDALYADGGLFANSPDILAVHEARHFLGQSEDELHVLSIGTTTAQYSFAHANGRHLGLFGWAQDQRLVSAMIAAQQQSVDYMMRHRFQDRYLRLDADQSKEQERHLALDVATDDAQKTIRGLAGATAQDWISKPSLRTFFAHEAPTPTFYHQVS